MHDRSPFDRQLAVVNRIRSMDVSMIPTQYRRYWEHYSFVHVGRDAKSGDWYERCGVW